MFRLALRAPRPPFCASCLRCARPTEGEQTGQVAVIPPDRPEWEEADELIPVLIGKFLPGTVPRYEVDSPVLEMLYPVLLERHGAS